MNAQNTRQTIIKQDQQHTLCYSFMIQLGISVSDKNTSFTPVCALQRNGYVCQKSI